jgi:hypothetical protein
MFFQVSLFIMFRKLFKGLKKEAEKIIEEVEEWEEEQEEGAQEETAITPTYGRYGRLAAWIKSNYGNRFRDGSTTEEVKQQLERVLRERERMGDFEDNPAIFKGFRAYIDNEEYGELVRIRE